MALPSVETFPGSYGGIPIFVTTSTVSGSIKGQKLIFPGSDKQGVESVGVNPPTIELTFYIDNKAYVQSRREMIDLLQSDESHLLVHPFQGQLYDYKCTTWSVDDRMTNVGVSRFTATFERDDIIGTPERAGNTLGSIESKHYSVLEQLIADFIDGYSVTPSFSGNFIDASGALGDLADDIQSNTSIITDEQNDGETFVKELRSFRANINSYAQNPEDLITNIVNMFYILDSLYSDPTDRVTQFNQFSNFGANDKEIIVTTVALRERNSNRMVLKNAVHCACLSFSYFNASQSNYATIQDIEAAAEVLETNYQAAISEGGLTAKTYKLLSDLRTQVQNYFNIAKVTAKRLTTIDTPLTSGSLLAFRYYGSTEKLGDLLDINQFDEITFIEGDVQVIIE